MLDDAALDTVFRAARTHYAWTGQPVGDADLYRVFDLLRMGPTSANCSPARFLFLRTPDRFTWWGQRVRLVREHLVGDLQ